MKPEHFKAVTSCKNCMFFTYKGMWCWEHGFYVGDEHSYACKDIKSRTENDDERTEEQKRWEK